MTKSNDEWQLIDLIVSGDSLPDILTPKKIWSVTQRRLLIIPLLEEKSNIFMINTVNENEADVSNIVLLVGTNSLPRDDQNNVVKKKNMRTFILPSAGT